MCLQFLYIIYTNICIYFKSQTCAGHPLWRCNTLQHTATHCNTLQHTATSCSTLQHMATHLWHTSETMHVYKIRHIVWMCLTQTVWMCLKHCLNVCHTNSLVLLPSIFGVEISQNSFVCWLQKLALSAGVVCMKVDYSLTMHQMDVRLQI